MAHATDAYRGDYLRDGTLQLSVKWMEMNVTHTQRHGLQMMSGREHWQIVRWQNVLLASSYWSWAKKRASVEYEAR